MMSTDAREKDIPSFLGLPLDEAILRLGLLGIVPRVTVSRAPRRPEGVGALRVVQQRKGGSELTACAFLLHPREETA